MDEPVTTDRTGRIQFRVMRALGLDSFAKETDCVSLRSSVSNCVEAADMAGGGIYARRALRIAYAAQRRIEELGCIEPVTLTRRATDPQPEI
ncbi:MAG: hypothetical protein JWO77_2611 [Ilumatobacteraceae bacterium]|nr:hypothetical protein [Ilumatobacteraceae bacterium]